jgi:lysylphosphatidylglycerol synthetase-like protein (DUF2156 family)
MTPRTRKFALMAHIVASLGWIGAVAAFIVLDVTTVASDEVPVLRAAYIGMDLITTWAIVPLAFAAFLTGIIMSLGTKWGLFRHYWVIVTLVLTMAATVVLLIQVPGIAYRADVAANAASSDEAMRGLGNLLLHSIGGTIVLLVITALNVYKPRGLTRYGWRKQQSEAAEARP